ncbi:MAG: ParB/RepB/Spo0J family partition protein [Lachnospiraceae bacterium]|nr:ParB/RepB/Spo0J family partition protein [Lachnospiraceae bacterium]
MKNENKDGMRRNEVTYINLDELHDFKDHPFQVRDDEDMERLVESVEQQGVLDPIIVRGRAEGGFEIVSGHRRTHAASVAGLSEIPAIVREIDDDEAVLAMVDANLHRETLLPSEKAFAYKMKRDALSRQGKRSDLTSNQVGWKLETASEIGAEAGDSGSQVRRYIRLTELIPELLIMVDDNAIKFNAGVELSFLSKEEQRAVLSIIDDHGLYPSLNQAKVIRQLSSEGEFSRAKVFRMLSLSSMKERKITLTEDRLMQYFHSGMTDDEMKEVIYGLLDEWSRKGRLS